MSWRNYIKSRERISPILIGVGIFFFTLTGYYFRLGIWETIDTNFISSIWAFAQVPAMIFAGVGLVYLYRTYQNQKEELNDNKIWEIKQSLLNLLPILIQQTKTHLDNIDFLGSEKLKWIERLNNEIYNYISYPEIALKYDTITAIKRICLYLFWYIEWKDAFRGWLLDGVSNVRSWERFKATLQIINYTQSLSRSLFFIMRGGNSTKGNLLSHADIEDLIFVFMGSIGNVERKFLWYYFIYLFDDTSDHTSELYFSFKESKFRSILFEWYYHDPEILKQLKLIFDDN